VGQTMASKSREKDDGSAKARIDIVERIFVRKEESSRSEYDSLLERACARAQALQNLQACLTETETVLENRRHLGSAMSW